MPPFGAFSTYDQGIILHFQRLSHWTHFSDLWSHKYNEPQMQASDPKVRFDLLCAGTILEHELRHFHDHLLAPTAASAFRARLVLLMNSLHLSSVLRDDKNCEVVPVPISDWLFMSSNERKRHIDTAQQWPDYKGCCFWDPPVFDTNQAIPNPGADISASARLKANASLIAKGARVIRTLRDGFLRDGKTIRMTPRFVYESSALLMQLFSVRNTYGDAEFMEFLHQLSTQPTVFNRVFLNWLIMAAGGHRDDVESGEFHFESCEDIDVCFLATAFTWCLLGHPNEEDNKRNGCPAVRMNMLFGALMDDPTAVYPAQLLNPKEYMKIWDEYFGTLTWSATLLRSLLLFRTAFAKFVRQFEASLPQGVNTLNSVPRLLESYMTHRNEFVMKFLKAPEAYIIPGIYLSKPTVWGTCPVTIDLSQADFYLDTRNLELGEGWAMTKPTRFDKGRASGFKLFCKTFFERGNYFNVEDSIAVSDWLRGNDILLFPEELEAEEWEHLSEAEDTLGFKIYNLAGSALRTEA